MKEQWQELKETIIEIRDNNKFNEDVSAICKFLINYMGVLEKQMQELCEYAPFTIDELEDEDMQKLLRGFKNQQVIVTDHDCSPSATIIEPCGDVPDINVGDMISRQAVLDYIHRIFNQGTGKKKSFEFIRKFVESLPSVQPKPNADVFDKIRAEIMKLQTYKMFEGEDAVYVENEDVLAIIDKYKAESEVEK
jgi:hypothetical protein